MDKKIAHQIASLVNSVKHYSMLKNYAEYRIEQHKNMLVTSKTFEDVLKHQSAIQELKRFLTLQEEVKSTVEDK